MRELDPIGFTLTAEAGVVLARAQEAARAQGLLFPLSMGSEGSAQIGGNLSTNAGGLAVLRYGTMRDLVLGLEVVLPNGEVLAELKGLRKDNTGYDSKALFLGAEGTLGVITAAVLKLFPEPRARATAWLAVASVDAACRLLGRARRESGDQVVSAEYVSRRSLELVLRHVDGARDPLVSPAEHYVLLELASADADEALRAKLERVLDDGARRRRDSRRHDRRVRSAAARSLAAARARARGRAARRRLREARRLGAHRPHRRVHRAGRARARAASRRIGCRSMATSATAICTSTCCRRQGRASRRSAPDQPRR